MGAESGEAFAAAALALTSALRPLVEAAAPPEAAGGWAGVYASRGLQPATPHDPLFLLRVIADHPSRFVTDDPDRTASAVAVARQRLTRALGPGDVEPARLAEACANVLLAFGLPVPDALSTTAPAPPRDVTADEAHPPVVQRWLGDLLDLSRRNRLISIEGHGIELLGGEGDLAAVEDVIADGLDLVVRGWDGLDDVDGDEWGDLLSRVTGPDDLSADFLGTMLADDGTVFARLDTASMRTTLTGLRRKAQVAAEESGVSPLYLSVGALRMGESLAPLFLIPVEIEGPRLGPWSIHLQAGSQPRLNECLVEHLRRAHSFVPGVLVHPPTDDAGIDVPRVFADLRRALAARRFPYEVVPDMRLALVHFSSMHMWRDLRDHAAEFTANPLVRHLATGAGPFVDPTPEPAPCDAEADLTLPVGADGSQMQAVHWARAGRTFVLQGPPGTGKSQTIANIVADAVASGRRVLFVAEKDAALEVVKRRLRAIGLEDRCLDLRAKDLTTLAVRTRLRQTVVLERTTDTAAQAQAREELRAHLDRLSVHPAAIRASTEGQVDVDGEQREQEATAYRDTAARLRAAVRDTVGQVGLPGPGEGWGGADPFAVLRRELRVAKADTVRDLIAAHTAEILTLTPCVLAGPTAVARHLPATAGLFDLVVFDEASQIRVESAIGAMGRAKAVVIVGDPQQMPPSDPLGGDAGAEASEQEESILLEAARAGLPVLRLSWHYRSRSEGLVSFSNRHYYDGALASFPTPPGGHAGTGVEFRRVPGRYEAGRGRKTRANVLEAQAVVAEVTRLLQEDPQASVGVVTFNMAQRDVVLDQLEERAPDVVRAALSREVEPLIVKSLEHIQGDERDHILFSLTYSVDASGKLPNNFGLLSRAGGSRRLNVAITRARIRNVLFASFDPTDITAGASSPGPAHLREYLLGAQFGQPTTATPASAPDECRRGLAADLRRAGLAVLEDVGLSTFKVDLAVRRGDGPWSAVLLDTAAWAQRPTVADRDGIPYTVLGDHMGWAEVVQVYRGEWTRDPDAVLSRILHRVDTAQAPRSVTAVEAAAHGGVDSATIAETVRRQGEAVRAASAAGVAVDAGPPGAAVGVGGLLVSALRPAHEDRVGDFAVVENLPARASVAAVQAQWRQVAAAEGPVQVAHAASVIARRFGRHRLHRARRDQLVAHIPADLARTRWGGETFLWPADVDPAGYRGLRTSTRPHRRIHEIAPEEIANAIRYVLADTGGRCTETELVRGVSELFGFGRVGHLIRAGILAVLEQRLVAAGEVARVGDEILAVAGGSGSLRPPSAGAGSVAARTVAAMFGRPR